MSDDFVFSNDPASCRNECESAYTFSAYCLNGELPQPQGGGIMSLYEFLKDPNQQALSSERLQRMFDIDEDPCERKATNLAAGEFSNSGLACALGSEITDLAAVATIKVPPYLNGKIQRIEDSVLLEFDDSGTAPALELSDEYLNEDWGGYIRHIEADGEHLRLGIGYQSCIQVRY